MNAGERFKKFLNRCKLLKAINRELLKRHLSPNSMFKVVNDYGWGDRSESKPMSLKGAIKEFENSRGSEVGENIWIGAIFDRTMICYIEECSFGWH